MSLMIITAIITLFMPADVDPQFLNHFGYIHLFSFLNLYSVLTAIIAIKKGQEKKHKLKMFFFECWSNHNRWRIYFYTRQIFTHLLFWELGIKKTTSV
jgi:uncharacterized membrane protein YkvA (DUF1232 family)